MLRESVESRGESSVLVAYDGSLQARQALRYGIYRARKHDSSVIVAHVFDIGMFIDYDAGPSAEAAARREFLSHQADARKIAGEEAGGVRVESIVCEGDPLGMIIEAVSKSDASMIVAPRRLGAVKGKAACPVCLVPGGILLPLDNCHAGLAGMEAIAEEAGVLGGAVVVLGLVPVHIYGSSEADKLQRLRCDIEAAVREAVEGFSAMGIKTEALLREGYPDEEVMKAAEEFSCSLVVLPGGCGESPSELAKTAAIITGETGWDFCMRQPQSDTQFCLTPY